MDDNVQLKPGMLLKSCNTIKGRKYRDWIVIDTDPLDGFFVIAPYHNHKWQHRLHVNEIQQIKVR